MPTRFALLAVVALVAGCDSNPGPIAPVSEPTPRRDSGRTGMMLVPLEDHVIRRGASSEVHILVDRGDFDGPVTIQLHNLPLGIHAAGAVSLSSGESRAVFGLKAGEDAELVNRREILVTAEAGGQEKATGTFLLTVTAPAPQVPPDPGRPD